MQTYSKQNHVGIYKVHSTYDLKNVSHQIPISQAESKYTAFEAGGQLYQFCRIPFGVTNGVCGVSATYGQNHQRGAAERHIPLSRRHLMSNRSMKLCNVDI